MRKGERQKEKGYACMYMRERDEEDAIERKERLKEITWFIFLVSINKNQKITEFSLFKETHQ